jgi:hypothetical protein
MIQLATESRTVSRSGVVLSAATGGSTRHFVNVTLTQATRLCDVRAQSTYSRARCVDAAGTTRGVRVY